MNQARHAELLAESEGNAEWLLGKGSINTSQGQITSYRNEILIAVKVSVLFC